MSLVILDQFVKKGLNAQNSTIRHVAVGVSANLAVASVHQGVKNMMIAARQKQMAAKRRGGN